MKRKPRQRNGRRPVLEVLEPRVLFSADLLGGLGHAVFSDSDWNLDPNIDPQTFAPPGTDWGIQPEQTTLSESAAAQESLRLELVLVDSNVTDYQQLVDELQSADEPDRAIQVVVLDDDTDGIDQVSQALAQHNSLDAVHLLSHGSGNGIQLGKTWLDADSLSGYQETIAHWGDALNDDADLLIYGCNLASGVQGQSLVNALSDLTGADVAASDDLTGNAALGGDWELEYQTGRLETSVTVSIQTQTVWSGTLATYAVTNTGDSGAGSLRQAITDANATSGIDDSIGFNISGTGTHTISIASALPSITDTVILDATTDDSFAANGDRPAIVLDGNGLTGNGMTLTPTADGSTIRGLVIREFSGDGILIESGADNVTIAGNWIGSDGTGSALAGNGDDGIDIRGANAIVGGTGANDGNVINNAGDEGITINGAGTTITGNIIGLEADGSSGSGNADVGVAVLSGADNTTIGGTTAAHRNVISNNYEGIEINTSNNVVEGNYIGTDASGTLDRGNRSDDGVEIQNNGSNNLIGGAANGAGNLIAFNHLDGVNIVSGSANTVLGNEIHSNDQLGIDLGTNGVTANDAADADTGANGLQNFPVLTSVDIDSASQLSIGGTLNTDGLNQDYRIEFFKNTIATGEDSTQHGEGEIYLGFATVTTDGSGDATFSTTLTASVTAGEFVTATATKDLSGGNYGDTSELALNVAATAVNDVPVVTSASLTLSEGETVTLGGANFGINDPDDVAFTYTLSGISGGYFQLSNNAGVAITSFSNADLSGGLVQFVDDGDENAPAFSVTVNDGDADSNTLAATINYTAVNDAPVATDDPGEFNTLVTFLSPISYWRLGESAEPSATDESGLSDGTYNGATLGQAGALAGDADTATSFDGLDDYVEIAHDAAYLLDNGTVQLWFNAATPANGDLQHLFSKDSNGYDTGGHLSIYLDAGGKLAVRLQSTAASYIVSSTAAVTGNAWHHAALSFGAEGMQLYLDGALIDSDAYTGGLGVTSGGAGNFEPIAIGGGTQNSGNLVVTSVTQLFTGRIDEVAIFNSQLDLETVQDLYASGWQNYTIDEEGSLAVGIADGVLANDFDIEGDPLTAVLASNPSHAASFTLNADGSFDYAPTANFSGVDTFTYKTNDGTADSNLATVTITVNPVNEAPTAQNDSYTISEDTGLAGQPSGSGWYDPAWAYREKLTFDNSTRAEDLVDFSVLVMLDSSRIDYSQIQDAGQDLRFVDADGTTLLAHEIESWDEAGTSYVWVKVPRIDQSSNSDYIWMYYGNGAAADGQDPGNVWNAGYRSVQHLDTDLLDSTSNSNDGSNSGSSDNAGPIAGGQHFDGVDDAVNLGSDPSVDDIFAGGGTVSAWINPTGWGEGGYGRILDKAATTMSADGWGLQLNSTTSAVRFEHGFSTDRGGWEAKGTISLNTWQHVVVTYDNSSTANAPLFYVNGALQTTTQDSSGGTPAGTASSDTAQNLTLGNHASATTRTFDGAIDEVRLSNTALSADWISAQYAAMTDTLVTFGTTEAAGILNNDSDPGNDALTASLVGDVSHGTLLLNADGSFTYTPNANFYGTDSFTYKANDTALDSNNAIVTIHVTAVGDTPQVADIATLEDTQSGPIVIDRNAADGAEVTHFRISAIGNGTLYLNDGTTAVNDGDFVTVAQGQAGLRFTPDADSTAAGAFAVEASEDGSSVAAQSGTATSTIAVTPVNDAPAGTDTTVTTLEDSAYTFAAADFGFSDALDGDNLQAVRIATLPTAGTLTLNGGALSAGDPIAKADIDAGKLTFAPAADANGAAYASFTFQVRDDGGTANGGVDLDPSPNTLTVDVTAVNDAPAFTTLGDQTVDEDAGAQTVASFATPLPGGGPDEAAQTFTYALSNGNGALFSVGPAIDASGTLTYTLAANASGTATVTVAVQDSGGVANGGDDTAPAQTFDIVVNPSNAAPVITSPATASVAENQTAALTVAASDADGDTPTFSLSGGADQGLFGIDANSGVLTFNAAPDFENPADADGDNVYRVQVTAADGNGGTDVQSLAVTVTDANEAPTFTSPAVKTATQDAAYTYRIATTDPDTGASLTIAAPTLPAWLRLTDNGDGTATLSGTPTNTEVGAHAVVLQVSDGSLVDTQSFTITVRDTNDAPVIAGNSTGTVTEDEDPDLDNRLETIGTLTISDPDVGESSFQTANVVGTYGTLTIDAPGNWSYSADNRQAAIQQLDAGETLSDVLTVTTADGTAHNVVITIDGAEDAPVLGGTTTGSVTEDGTLTAGGMLSIADTDASDNPIGFPDAASTLGDSGYGSFILSNGTWTYTLNNAHAAVQALDAGERLTDTHTFTASDGSTRTVSVTIDGAEDTPKVIAVDLGNIDDDGILVITQEQLLASTSDIDGDSLSVSNLALSSGSGTLVDNQDGTWTFVPTTDWNGSVGFSFEVDDGSTTATTSASLSVNAVADPPPSAGDGTGIEGSLPGIGKAVPLAHDSNASFNNRIQGAVGEVLPPDTVQTTAGGTGPASVAQREIATELDSDSDETSTDKVSDPEPTIVIDEIIEPRPMDDAVLASVVADVQRYTGPSEYRSLADSPIPPKAIDLRNLDVAPFESGSQPVRMGSPMDNSSFTEGLEAMHHDLDKAVADGDARYRLEAETVIGATMSLSAGFVSWVLRTGSLMASFMSTVPLWKQFDPLPILGAGMVAKHKGQAQPNAAQADQNTKVEELFKQEPSE